MPRQEEREVADVFANLALTLERGGIERGIRFDQHFPHVFQVFPAAVADFVELVGVKEIDQQVGQVPRHLMIVEVELVIEVFPDQLSEQLP